MVGLAALLLFMRQYGRSRKIQHPNEAAHPLFTSLGRPFIRALSISEISRLDSFLARVKSRRIETNSITVLLKKADGNELAIYEQNPSTNAIAILSSLKEATDYSFPAALRRSDDQEQ